MKRFVRPPRVFVLIAVLALVITVATARITKDSSTSLGLGELESRASAGRVSTARIADRDNVVTGKLVDGATYRTSFPTDYGDELTTKLLAGDVQVEANSQRPSIWVGLIATLLPVVLILSVLVWFMTKSGAGGRGLMQLGRSKAKRWKADGPAITFADVAGIDEAVGELAEIHEFLKHPARFHAVGARIPRGVLLSGPPGTGKTLLARAVAGEAGVPFFSISGSDFVEMFVGVGAARVRDLFQQAKAEAPAIIFVDEIDAVGRHRGQGLAGSNDEREQTLNQLLVEMDGFDNTTGVIVIAGTNRVDVLDSALLRPGRFDRQIVLDRPDVAGRQAILAVHAKDRPFASDVDLKVLARRTPGFTGADLANALNEAAIFAARRSATEITMHDLTAATERVLGGPERRSKVLTEADKRVVAFHEAGHALVGHMTGGDTIHKVSIIARGQALGLTIAVPETDRVMHRRSELVGRIAMLFGGRCAEELVLGESTSGASDDILRATEIAKMMVTQFGMSDAVGLRQIGPAEPEFGAARDHGEAVAALVDTEINRLLDEGRQQAAHIVLAHRDRLELIAEQLIEQETLDEGQLAQFFAGLVPSNS